MAQGKVINHYFVDEAGDLTLFGRRGKVLIGARGCSTTFMVGAAYVPDPERAGTVLSALRAELQADPYFKGVPSMQPEEGKTALYFCAKNDLPEVRREVLKLLPSLHAKVQVVIRRKEELVRFAKFLYSAGQHLTANHVYDDLVKRLFCNLLHKADANRVVFARRGKSDRYLALSNAIAKAKRNFEIKWGIPSDKPTEIRSGFPPAHPGLQVIDYYLWALQRLYERGEGRYFELLREDYRLIMDLDDKRRKPYGEWYSDSNPLDPERIKAF